MNKNKKQVIITRISRNQNIKPGSPYISNGQRYTVDSYDPLTGDLVLCLMMSADGMDRSHNSNQNDGYLESPELRSPLPSSYNSGGESYDSGGSDSGGSDSGGGSDGGGGGD